MQLPVQCVLLFFPGGKAAGAWRWPLISYWRRDWEWLHLYRYSFLHGVDKDNFTSLYLCLSLYTFCFVLLCTRLNFRRQRGFVAWSFLIIMYTFLIYPLRAARSAYAIFSLNAGLISGRVGFWNVCVPVLLPSCSLIRCVETVSM